MQNSSKLFLSVLLCLIFVQNALDSRLLVLEQSHLFTSRALIQNKDANINKSEALKQKDKQT